MNPHPISEEEYMAANEEHLGFCTNCEEFTNGECEPDARNYICDVCENYTVFGAEEALLMGLIEIE